MNTQKATAQSTPRATTAAHPAAMTGSTVSKIVAPAPAHGGQNAASLSAGRPWRASGFRTRYAAGSRRRGSSCRAAFTHGLAG